jgi:hypothetical protein
VFVPDQDCADDPCASIDDCPADALFGQPRSAPDHFEAYTSESSSGFQRWEDFSRVAGAIQTIRWSGLDMHFTGITFEECDDTENLFLIRINSDEAGAPGQLVCEWVVQPDVVSVSEDYGAELKHYSVELPEPCIVVRGWISIVGLEDPTCWFLWINSPDGNDHSMCEGCASTIQTDDLSVCLVGMFGDVSGACCDESSAACTDDAAIDTCLDIGTRFEPDTTCAVVGCEIVTGACCADDGNHTVGTEVECFALDGNWLGGGTTSADCPPLGACCTGNETCTVTTELDCLSENLNWLGPDTLCEACPQVPLCSPEALYGDSPDGPDDFQGLTSEFDAGLRRSDRVVAVSGPVDAVTFWGFDLEHLGGSDFGECTEFDPTFEVEFRRDAGGVPGEVVCTTTAQATRQPLGVLYLGTELNEYHIVLPEPCVLVHGWLSIVGLGDPDCWFLWLSAGAGSSHCDGCTEAGSDLAFCLEGQSGGVSGACCSDGSTTCDDAVDIVDCLSTEQRFAPDTTCEGLDPPCGVVQGACCSASGCQSTTLDECPSGVGRWQGPHTACDACPCVVECPEDARFEGEPVCGPDYEDQVNGGCNVDAPVFVDTIACQTMCGTSGVFESGGDLVPEQDWLELDLHAPTEVFWRVDAEFPVRLTIYDTELGCAGAEPLLTTVGLPCETAELSIGSLGGALWLVVEPAGAVDSAACGARYVSRVEFLEPCPTGDIEPDGDVDLDDYAALFDCLGGPDVLPSPPPPLTAALCRIAFDLDIDGDVDLRDVAEFVLRW